MDSWKTRFQGNWPYMTSLYRGEAESGNGDRLPREDSIRKARRKKYENPLLGYDNVFNPINTYGAYNYYVSSREDVRRVSDPTVLHRYASSVQDGSAASVTPERRKPGSGRFPIYIFLILIFIGVIVASIVLSVILTQTSSLATTTTTSAPPNITTVQGEITVFNRNFTDALNDNTSEEFQSLATDFCDSIRDLYQTGDNTELKNTLDDCVVEGFREGSVIVIYILIFTITPATQDVEILTVTQIQNNNAVGFGSALLVLSNPSTPVIVAINGVSLPTTVPPTTPDIVLSSSFPVSPSSTSSTPALTESSSAMQTSSSAVQSSISITSVEEFIASDMLDSFV